MMERRVNAGSSYASWSAGAYGNPEKRVKQSRNINLNAQEGAGRTLIERLQATKRGKRCPDAASGRPRLAVPGRSSLRALALALVPPLLALAGCGGGTAGGSGGNLSISPGSVTIDTNCTGCNGTNSYGSAVEQFSATLSGGGAASVTWKVSGGDAVAGPGSISNGQYSPPSYLTANSVTVTVTATLASGTAASAQVTVTPGFLQPLTPENVALGAGGTATITGYLAESGGTDGINYVLATSPTGSSGGQGSLGGSSCVRSSNAFTYCAVTYTAPAAVTSTATTYVVATVGGSSSKTATVVLLNTAGVESNPSTHQAQQLNMAISLGSSGGNNKDYDANSSDKVTDCCGGTLGSLIQNSSGTQYLLSCNHVLARSDQASLGEAIVQPGLIDDNCVPYGQMDAATTPVGVLSGFVQLNSSTSNVDAAIAQVNSGAVSTSGNILELGAKQANGSLSAAPPGGSSTGGKGKAGTLNMSVAKSGRTTGLTCAAISAIDLSVEVSYFTNCAETNPYYTKTYSGQIAVTGNEFSDAGDSGSLVVDSNDAEPVGLFFAGGVDSSGVSEGIANPVAEVLSELSSQVGNGTSYTFVGTADHTVSCLDYGNATVSAAQARTLSDSENSRIEQALEPARALVNPSTGILGVGTGKSSDHIGEGAVILYVDQNMNVTAPETVAGVRTIMIPTTPEAVVLGSAQQSPLETGPAVPLANAVLTQAVIVKQKVARGLMKQNPAFFGVGVGQSLDNPREAALVVYVDRRQVPGQLPAAIDGLRVRYVIMDRLHVTRSYATGLQSRSRCSIHGNAGHGTAGQTGDTDPFHLHQLRGFNLY